MVNINILISLLATRKRCYLWKGQQMPEQTLIIFKPDAIQRGLVAEILQRFEDKCLKFVGFKMIHIDRELAEKHYAEHKGKDFYEPLVKYITSAPVIIAVLEGPSAVAVVRTLLGKTDGRDAAPGTIRGDFGISMRYNLVHGSDSSESAKREIGLFFKNDELFSYDRDILKWSWQE